MTVTNIACSTCGTGQLVRRRKFRMSAPVVLIGFILLIPCVIGMASAAMAVVASSVPMELDPEAGNMSVKHALREAGVDAELADAVIAGRLTDADREALTPDEREAVLNAEVTLTAGGVGSAAGRGLGIVGGIFLFIFSFVGGLLGWLLVMRKTVLQCNHCGAAVAAS